MSFSRRARSYQRSERKAMIDRGHEFSVRRQAQWLELPRSTVYNLPKPTASDDLALMRLRDFTDLLKAHGVTVSMDGKGCWCDNVFVERFWESIKYEAVYLHAYDNVSEARPYRTLNRLLQPTQGHTVRLTATCPRAFTSLRCHFPWQLNPQGCT